MGFTKWLGTNNTVVTVVEQVVGQSLSCTIVTVSDNETLQLKTFVRVERALVSYDKGFYTKISHCDEIDKLIDELIEKYNNW